MAKGTSPVGLLAPSLTVVGAIIAAKWADLFAFLHTASTFLPTWLRVVWIIPAVALIPLFAVSSYFWFWNSTHRDQYVQDNAQQIQVKINEQKHDAATLGYLSTEDDSRLEVTSPLPKRAVQRLDRYIDKDLGIEIQRLLIVEPDGRQTNMDFAKLYNRSAWAQGDMAHIHGPDGQPVHIQDAITHADIADIIQKARRIICFGFASSDRGDLSEDENEGLSQDRAINVCKAIAKLGYVDFKHQETIAAALGEATPDSVMRFDPLKERPVLIVGIYEAPRGDPPARILNQLMLANDPADFDLTKYSDFNAVRSIRNVSGAGDYTGRAAIAGAVPVEGLYTDKPIELLVSRDQLKARDTTVVPSTPTE